MKYKLIKGVAHNLGHSFLSDTNAVMREGVYTIIPDLLFSAARAAAVPRVDIDLLLETVQPPELALPELAKSLAFYHGWLPSLLSSHGVDPGVIQEATISIGFDYTRVRRSQLDPTHEIPEFSCTVRLTDDRGITHEAMPKDWWCS